MSDVSVIGLGAMGSALARALLRDGHRVTVWNRTNAKAEPLVRDGAALAPDPASAVADSPVVVVSVDDYEVTYTILSQPEVRPHLAGRVMVQLSSGTPREAREGERWARDSEAEYLDGEILAYPDMIGTPEAAIVVAGAEETLRRCEPLLRSLAGGLTYLGEQVGAAAALTMAVMSVTYGALLGAIHGARVCEVEALRVDDFASRLQADDMPTIGVAVKELGERIQANQYDESQATLRTYAVAAEQFLQHARDSRIDTNFPVYVSGTLQKGMNAGLGGDDLAALIKVLRAGSEQAGEADGAQNIESTTRKER